MLTHDKKRAHKVQEANDAKIDRYRLNNSSSIVKYKNRSFIRV